MKKKYYIILASLILVIVVAIAFARKSSSVTPEDFQFETAVVKKGKIVNTVTATGTLEAVETVEVGTQVSGIVNKILVDFNSNVRKGQVLAKIDETPLVAQLNQSQANVDQAEAEFKYQSANYQRNLVLFEKKLISQADFDQVVYSYNLSKANLASSNAQHDRNKINLDYATIVSPIDGVILDRAVDEGQTVAASFNTPTLFTIANDLTQMKVEASVDEADIGLVHAGQRVEFTVDAFPDEIFEGTVIEVRLQPVITSNVVTYTVIINAPNPEKKLMPGMTATTAVYVLEEDNQLLVPIQALSFDPQPDLLFAYMTSVRSDEEEVLPPPNPVQEGTQSSGMTKEVSKPKVWVKSQDSLFSVPVEVTIDDGINYSVTGGLNEGDEVVLGMTGKSGVIEKSDGAAVSPFMPKPPQRR
jgi:HlyD family secretion protein